MDPMKNNNTPVIKRIAKRALKAGRTRNIFAVCAIILTTFMLASVFSVGISLLRNMEIWQVRTAGTAASIFLKSPTKEQTLQIKSQSQAKAVGTQISLGGLKGKTSAGKPLQIALGWFDTTEFKQHITPAVSNIKGHYPKRCDEIMLSEKALEQLGVKAPRQGQTIELSFQLQSRSGARAETETERFRLSGWYTDYTPSQSGIALVSEDFCLQKGFTAEQDGRLSISCDAGKREDCLQQLEDQISLSKGQEFEASFDLQEQNRDNYLSVGGSLLIMALFIVLSGYLLIYNVIYISVAKDIRFYGMLKTLGTSPRQIRKLVRSQILRLSAAGIPAGLLLAAAASFAVVPYAMTFFKSGQENQAMPDTVSFEPVIFIAAAFFALLTVIVSCKTPVKIASRVSPAEALKYTDASFGKQKSRTTRSGGKLYKMAFHNIFRGKKRSILVFASLFMGTITFLGVASYIESMQPDNYIARYVPDDFRITSSPPIVQKFDKQYLQSLSSIDGVTELKTLSASSCNLDFDPQVLEPVIRHEQERYGQAADDGSYEDLVRVLSNLADQGELTVWVVGMDESYIKEYNEKHKEKIDADAFLRGETAIIGYDDGTAYRDMLGRSLKLFSAGGKTVSVKIDGIFDYEDCSFYGDGTFVGMMEVIFVSDTVMKKLAKNPIVADIIINCDPEKEPYVKQEITRLNHTLTDKSFSCTAKSDEKEEFKASMMALYIMGGGLSILLLVIGILNFINVMLTSVYTRHSELAVLESIGMTKKQIKRMLTWEGGFYAIITSLLILTLGNGLLYLMSRSIDKLADYAVFHYPVLLTVLLILCIFAICLTVPRIVFCTISKESVTQRLRQTNN